jgi:hypothetical protein
MHRVRNRAWLEQGEQRRSPHLRLQAGEQARDRGAFARETAVECETLATHKRQLRIGAGERGLGLLDARAERRGGNYRALACQCGGSRLPVERGGSLARPRAFASRLRESPARLGAIGRRGGGRPQGRRGTRSQERTCRHECE